MAYCHSDPTALYHLWAENDVLLYIGVSHDPQKRLGQHRGKPWGRLIVDWEWEWHPNRLAAETAEARAIMNEAPLFNQSYNAGRERMWWWLLGEQAPPTLWVKRLPDFAYICKHEPRMLDLLERVRRMRGMCGECCWPAVRREVAELVGWKASNPEVASSYAYTAAMTFMWEALPWAVCREHQFEFEESPA